MKNRHVLGERDSEMSKSSSCVNIIVNRFSDKNIPTSWNYGSFNPSSNYFSRMQIHNKENLVNINLSPELGNNSRDMKFSDPEYIKSFNLHTQKDRLRRKDRNEDPVRISREGSHSASRIIDALQKIKSPSDLKVPKETLELIDKVIRKRIYPPKPLLSPSPS